MPWVKARIHFLKVIHFSFPVPVVVSRSLRHSLCRQEHKEFLVCALRSRKISNFYLWASLRHEVMTYALN